MKAEVYAVAYMRCGKDTKKMENRMKRLFFHFSIFSNFCLSSVGASPVCFFTNRVKWAGL